MTDHAAILPRLDRSRGGPDRVTVMLLTLAAFLAVFAILAARLQVTRRRLLRHRHAWSCCGASIERQSSMTAGRMGAAARRRCQCRHRRHCAHDAAAHDPHLHAPMSHELDYTFAAMGSEVRLLIEPPLLPGLPPALEAADRERAFVWDFARRLSRFVSDSELSAFNRDPRCVVPASRLLRAAVGAGVWAARRSGGLVDPTLGGALEAAGYVTSMADRTPASLADALAWAPVRRAAQPAAVSQWAQIVVNAQAGTIARPARHDLRYRRNR